MKQLRVGEVAYRDSGAYLGHPNLFLWSAIKMCRIQREKKLSQVAKKM